MDEKMRISNAEMKVMNQIWKAEEMVTVPEVLEILKKEGEEWTYPTVATFLRRLTAEGDFRGNEEGKQALLFPFGKQRTV